MAEREFPMIPSGVEYVCDKCGEGLMEPHGRAAYLSDPIQFPHRCNKCGHEQAFKEQYPAVRWRRAPS
jgi:DNA-directed RNA polymerase subunit RPC12/RpoP